MGEALHLRRVEILRYLARRDRWATAERAWGGARGDLRSSQTIQHHLGRLEGKEFVVREGE